MLSRTSEYALRAMIHLAQHVERWPMTGRQIAEEAAIPAKYLGKILGDLVRAGVLDSARGLGGGFRMSRSPEAVSLFEVLSPFEPFHMRRCPFGNKQCGDENPCLAHDRWKHVVDVQQSFLRRTTVWDVAVSEQGRKKRRGAKARRKR